MTNTDGIKESREAITEKKRIRGWLLVLCIALIIIRTFIILVLASLFFIYSNWLVGTLLFALGSVFGVSSGVMLWIKARHAVTCAKAYLIIQPYILLGVGFLIETIIDSTDGVLGLQIIMIPYIISVIGSLIWFPYLTFSKRVKSIYKLNEKKRSISLAFVIGAAIAVLAPLFLGIALWLISFTFSG